MKGRVVRETMAAEISSGGRIRNVCYLWAIRMFLLPNFNLKKELFGRIVLNHMYFETDFKVFKM